MFKSYDFIVLSKIFLYSVVLIGLSMVSEVYKESDARGKAMAIAYTGLNAGLIGKVNSVFTKCDFSGQKLPPALSSLILILIGMYCMKPDYFSVGFPFGSVVYEYMGREVTFLALCGLIIFGASKKHLLYINRMGVREESRGPK